MGLCSASSLASRNLDNTPQNTQKPHCTARTGSEILKGYPHLTVEDVRAASACTGMPMGEAGLPVAREGRLAEGATLRREDIYDDDGR